jgi:hypothetical protein
MLILPIAYPLWGNVPFAHIRFMISESFLCSRVYLIYDIRNRTGAKSMSESLISKENCRKKGKKICGVAHPYFKIKPFSILKRKVPFRWGGHRSCN